MGIDIQLFRDSALAKLVRESQRRRFADVGTVDTIIELDEAWRKAQFVTEKCKKMINVCSKAVSAKKKKGEADGDVAAVPDDVLAAARRGELDEARVQELCVRQLKELSRAMSGRVGELAKEADELVQQRDKLANNVGNLLHESVPVSNDEDTGNAIVATWGDVTRRVRYNHVECMEKLGYMDTSKTITAMAGGRAYVLRGALVQLQLALIHYAVQFAMQRGFDPFYPPFFLNKEVMSEVAQLSEFDDALYKVSGDGEEKYLIATSEMSLVAFHRGKWFAELPQPLRYAGVSTCFRKEAGAHGRDTLGIFRVHQFDKVEQFVVCSPREGESWRLLEEMIRNARDFNESLGLPYRVVSICSGALNNAAAMKYDLEGWFPGSGAFRELVSCSNCTDYQSRSVDCRYGANTRGVAANATKEYCHMLNGTLCAVTRTMCSICENYQTDEGVRVPEVLQPYMGGATLLRFADADADAKAAAAAANAADADDSNKKDNNNNNKSGSDEDNNNKSSDEAPAA